MKHTNQYHLFSEGILLLYTLTGVFLGCIVGVFPGLIFHNLGAFIPAGALVGLIVGIIVESSKSSE